jgi:hypothetical protein
MTREGLTQKAAQLGGFLLYDGIIVLQVHR